MRILRKADGFTLVELLIASVIFLLLLGGVVQWQGNVLRQFSANDDKPEVARYKMANSIGIILEMMREARDIRITTTTGIGTGTGEFISLGFYDMDTEAKTADKTANPSGYVYRKFITFDAVNKRIVLSFSRQKTVGAVTDTTEWVSESTQTLGNNVTSFSVTRKDFMETTSDGSEGTSLVSPGTTRNYDFRATYDRDGTKFVMAFSVTPEGK